MKLALGAVAGALVLVAPWLAPSHALADPAPDAQGDAEIAARRAERARSAGTPASIVPLLGVLDRWEEVDDRAAIGRLLDEAAGDGKERADVRARATYLRSIVADREGDRARATQLRQSIGLVTRWRVVGPFDNEGRGGFAAHYPPEADAAAPTFDEKKEYQGRAGRPVRWRELPERVTLQGLVPLDAALRPSDNVVGYATTWIESPTATAAAIRLGSSGAVKVWLNGREVFARDVYRPVRLDQDVAGVKLRAGWNRVTVKLGAAEGGWAFFLRVTRTDGKPLAFTASSAAPAAPIPVDGSQAKAPAVQDLATLLRQQADAASRGRPPAEAGKEGHGAMKRKAAPAVEAAAMRALGLYLHYVAPDDPEGKGAERAMKRAVELSPTVATLREAAMVTGDANERRRFLERAVAVGQAQAKRTPDETRALARALLELGESLAAAHRERSAEERWRAALAIDPDFVPAELRLAELAQDRGLPSEAQRTFEALTAKHAAIAIVRLGARLADRRGRRFLADALQKKIVAATADDYDALRTLFSYARDRGDTAAALHDLDAMSAARPDLLAPVFDRADLLDAAARSGEAHDVLAAARALCPDDPRLLERDGKLLHRLGREELAVDALRKSLEVRPQNPELRSYLREIETALARLKNGSSPSDAAADLARAWARPMADVLAAARAKPPQKGDAARVLLDLSATRVHSNGLSETFSQRAVEILDERGAREMTDVDIRFTPDTQAVEVHAARVYKKSGEVVEAIAQTDRDLSEPWYGLYYDVHAQVIEFARLDPGDVIDVEYVVSDRGGKNMFADYYGDLHFLQEEVPRLESTYVLITPKARAFYFNQPKIKGATVEQAERGDERVYTVRAFDVPKVEAEPGMPGYSDVAAYVHVSTYKTWEDVAQWYRGLVGEQLQPDDAIRQAVAAAVKGLADEKAKIRTLYDLVVKKTRYVGLEFGIHGYQPYRVSQIYARKFGDCKDKASLLVSMLREIGVTATLVLARTRHGGDLDPFPASLAIFDHAIVYVPKYDLYLDGTAEFSGSDELPAQDQDIPVLLVADPAQGGKGHLVRTPVLPADRNRVAKVLDVKLAGDGSAKVDETETVSGEVAHQWRSHYQTAGERRERFEKAENQAHPGARVLDVKFPSVDDLEQPVAVKAALEIPSWARPLRQAVTTAQAGPGTVAVPQDLVMPALGHDGDLLRSYARLSERSYDLVLGFPWTQEERVTIALPVGYAPRRLPEAKRIDSPFGSFTLTVERKGQEVVVATALTVNRHRIAKADYPEFRKFCAAVDAAVGQEMVLAHE